MQFGVERVDLRLEHLPAVVAVVGRQRIERLTDGGLDDVGVQQLITDRLEHERVERLEGRFPSVAAAAPAAGDVVPAGQPRHPAPTVRARPDRERPVTAAARREAGEQVRRNRAGDGSPTRTRTRCEGGPPAVEPGSDGLPDRLRNDPQVWRVEAHHLVGLPRLLPVTAPGVPLARLVPDDFAAVEIPVEHLVDARRRPRRWAAPLRARRRHAFLVELQRDSTLAEPRRRQLEDAPHDGGLGLVDDTLDVPGLGPPVVVPERPAARDVPRRGLPGHRVVRPLPRAVPLELVGEGRDGHQQLVSRPVERPFAALEVREHPDARGHQLLERVRRLDRFAAEP
ncbi:MAG: hypothetical protein Q8L86_03105 [Vicinamibacterales bacterium]|nr:hypothetical protein [Vicinamibacterales bacterium]